MYREKDSVMDMNEAIQEAYAYADPEVTIYETFELIHSSWSGFDSDSDSDTDASILLVDSDRVLVTADGTFQPVTFTASLPETESSVRGQLKLTISFLPKEYRDMLWEASQSPETDPVYLYYRQYIGEGAEEEAAAELPVPLVVNTIEFTDEQTLINALYPDLVNIPFGRRIMSVTELPGART